MKIKKKKKELGVGNVKKRPLDISKLISTRYISPIFFFFFFIQNTKIRETLFFFFLSFSTSFSRGIIFYFLKRDKLYIYILSHIYGYGRYSGKGE